VPQRRVKRQEPGEVAVIERGTGGSVVGMTEKSQLQRALGETAESGGRETTSADDTPRFKTKMHRGQQRGARGAVGREQRSMTRAGSVDGAKRPTRNECPLTP